MSKFHMPFYPQSVVSQGVCPNSLFFRCFHLRLTIESIKELVSASRMVLWIKKSSTQVYFQEVMHYTISFYVLIYLPSGQAIVQSILNPSFQLWRNVTCILRFMWLKITIKCSMGQSTILMGVLLMISNIFYNIWILVQTFHGKLGNAPLFFYLGCLGSPWWSSSPKL
jgi:hypothetical protein